ncbi:class I SAM-dependent methyltransferase [Arthrobacter sp. MP_2.3]|uniref:class I SAM-dependent methyltransferase n=1 Tax=Arthrobacter sp. MP_2.3 TaxID=3349633 RepID=UPI0038D4951D
MSGFSPEWLALREPADHRARDADLEQRMAAHFAARTHVSVVDLGCGSGSNLRGTAKFLPDHQSWRLVDYDAQLLALARHRLVEWADESRTEGTLLRLRKDHKHVNVSFVEADLTRELAQVLTPAPDLVTAAALFDLVSEPWLELFTAALGAAGLPLYTVLSYDGRQEWQPPHQQDGRVLRAFNGHQQWDKGFGPATGPRAAAVLSGLLEARGYAVHTAGSPWLLGPDDPDLRHELATGIAAAAVETQELTPEEADGWLAARREAGQAMIGHTDIFATP